jgi:hypothetical protein
VFLLLLAFVIPTVISNDWGWVATFVLVVALIVLGDKADDAQSEDKE